MRSFIVVLILVTAFGVGLDAQVKPADSPKVETPKMPAETMAKYWKALADYRDAQLAIERLEESKEMRKALNALQGAVNDMQTVCGKTHEFTVNPMSGKPLHPDVDGQPVCTPKPVTTGQNPPVQGNNRSQQ